MPFTPEQKREHRRGMSDAQRAREAARQRERRREATEWPRKRKRLQREAEAALATYRAYERGAPPKTLKALVSAFRGAHKRLTDHLLLDADE